MTSIDFDCGHEWDARASGGKFEKFRKKKKTYCSIPCWCERPAREHTPCQHKNNEILCGHERDARASEQRDCKNHKIIQHPDKDLKLRLTHSVNKSYFPE